MSSTEYRNLINKYEAVVVKITGLYDQLAKCYDSVNKCIPLVKETKIDGEYIDQGKLENSLLVLEQMEEIFNTVIAECKLKIDTYEALHLMALEDEKNSTE